MPRSKGRTGRPWRRVRAAVLLASGGICWICGKPGADSVDHVKPLSKGGAPLDPRNLRAAHIACNSRRGNKLAETSTSRRW